MSVLYQEINLRLQSKMAATLGVHLSYVRCGLQHAGTAVVNDESVGQFVVVTQTLFPSHLNMHT